MVTLLALCALGLTTFSPPRAPGDEIHIRAYADKRIDAFRFTTSPAARKKMYPELVRWFQEEGSIVVFSNEIQRYWMKPNVHNAGPLPSLELRFEDSWIA